MLEVYFYSGFAVSSQRLLHSDIKQNSTNVRLSSRGLADGSVKFSWQPSCLKLLLPEASSLILEIYSSVYAVLFVYLVVYN